MKEYSIRPKDLYNEYIRLALVDAQGMRGERQQGACPACHNSATVFAFEKYGFAYERCPLCDTLFCNPRPTLAQLDEFYRNSESARFWNEVLWPEVEENRRQHIFGPRAQSIQRHLGERGIRFHRFMDIGAGNGIFLGEMRKLAPSAEYMALDPGSTAIRQCQEKGLKTYQTTVEEAKDWEGVADFATCFEVIEHSHDPEKFVAGIRKLLAPGGTLLMTALNYRGLDLGILGKLSGQVLPPLHINFMGPTGYRLLFMRAGFTSVEIVSPGKLDVDILENAYRAGTIGPEELGPFLTSLLDGGDEQLKASFQDFIAHQGMSSHVWIWAHN